MVPLLPSMATQLLLIIARAFKLILTGCLSTGRSFRGASCSCWRVRLCNRSFKHTQLVPNLFASHTPMQKRSVMQSSHTVGTHGRSVCSVILTCSRASCSEKSPTDLRVSRRKAGAFQRKPSFARLPGAARLRSLFFKHVCEGRRRCGQYAPALGGHRCRSEFTPSRASARLAVFHAGHTFLFRTLMKYSCNARRSILTRTTTFASSTSCCSSSHHLK